MATAKKLPSGSWRCLAYSHTETVWNEKQGQWVEKRIYESFTSDDPSPRGRKEAELAAAEFQLNNRARKKAGLSQSNTNLTLREAIEKYINTSDGVLSPSTIHGYRIVMENGFKSLMNVRLKDITPESLQEAVNEEAKLMIGKNPHKISPKTVKNRYGLITAVLNRYMPSFSAHSRLPQLENQIVILPDPQNILSAFKGDRLELAVLLAMWLSFSMSEIRGLTKSNSIDGDYIVIRDVKIKLGKNDIVKSQGKVFTRNRMHHIPPYIKNLIDQVEGDVLVPYSADAIYRHFSRVLEQNHISHISFHKLRHMNASIMAMLNIPEKYAMERGGWKTDSVMKKVYTHTFQKERIQVDHMIDEYFDTTMQHEMQHKKEKSP